MYSCAKKTDGTFWMCTDYKKVNSVTKTDSFPVPRMNDCIDNIGQAKYVTKFDLLKVGACSANFIPILLKYFLNYQLQFLTTKRISFTTKSSKEN